MEWTVPLCLRKWSAWNGEGCWGITIKIKTNTVSLCGELWNSQELYVEEPSHHGIIVHTPASTPTLAHTYKQKGKQGLVHIFQFICSISVFLFRSFCLFLFPVMFAFTTVELCFNLLYRGVYFVWFYFVVFSSWFVFYNYFPCACLRSQCVM